MQKIRKKELYAKTAKKKKKKKRTFCVTNAVEI